MTDTTTAIYKRPAELLQRLIRFETVNPPGNEAACIGYIDGLLREAGFQTSILARDQARPNLIARLDGRGAAPPLLMQGHVDVVTVEDQAWQQPPFAANVVDDFIWGRGALDMKAGVSMMLSALLRARAEGLVPAGDVVLVILSDEEAGGDMGARFLVENHAELFEGIEYGVGEAGGFTLHLDDRRFYPIMVTEKQICWLKATVRGLGGHGSRPVRGGAMAKLGALLTALDQEKLPVHITPVARQMIEAVADALPDATGDVLRQLLDPEQTDAALEMLGEELGGLLGPRLHNTISPTVVRGGGKVNVIPSRITLEMDGRLLPAFAPDDLLSELRAVIGEEVELEVVRHDPGPGEPDMGLFDMLSEILHEADPEAISVPLMLTGVTDARFFAQLGIQTYGFLPMNLPEGFQFARTIHAADERIPVESVAFGTDCLYRLLQRYGEPGI